MEKRKGFTNIDSADIESGIIRRVWVPTKMLKRLPQKEPKRTEFLKRIHDTFLMVEGRDPN